MDRRGFLALLRNSAVVASVPSLAMAGSAEAKSASVIVEGVPARICYKYAKGINKWIPFKNTQQHLEDLADWLGSIDTNKPVHLEVHATEMSRDIYDVVMRPVNEMVDDFSNQFSEHNERVFIDSQIASAEFDLKRAKRNRQKTKGAAKAQDFKEREGITCSSLKTISLN